MGIILFIILVVAGISVYDYLDSRHWQSATSTSRNSVIFENRNKKYGAYHLRSDYNDSLGIIVGMLAFALILVSIVSATIGSSAVKLEIPAADNIAMEISAPPIEEMITITTPYKIAGNAGHGGAGSPSSDPVINRPMEQTERIATQETSDHSVPAGQSNKTNGSNPDNRASSMVHAVNPFGSGGSSEGRFAGTFGNDPGPSSGPGGEGNEAFGGSARKKLSSLNADDIESNIDCTIHLKVYINAEGTVVRAENEGRKTTTANTTFIASIIDLVKRQIRYEKRPGTAVQVQSLPIRVNAR